MIDKAAVRAEFQRHDRDTGSSEVQIAQLTKEILALTEHLKANKKDHSSRYGLLRKVNNRRSLLDYLKREDEAKYRDLIKKLGLRRYKIGTSRCKVQSSLRSTSPGRTSSSRRAFSRCRPQAR